MAAIAVAAPLALSLSGIRLPAVVLEIVLGIVVGRTSSAGRLSTSRCGVLSLVGLAFLLP